MENDLTRLLKHPMWQEAADYWEAMSPKERAAEHVRMEEEALNKARQDYEENQKRVKLRRARESSERTGMGVEYQKWTFANIKRTDDNKAQYDYLVRYAKDFKNRKKGVYIFGKPGRGKTILMAALANELAAKDVTVAFRSAMAWVDDIMDTYGTAESTLKRVNEILDYELIILDDIDKVRPTPHNIGLMQDIIERIYSRGIRLAATANMPRDRLPYGEMFTSRMAALCVSLEEVNGPDWRVVFERRQP